MKRKKRALFGLLTFLINALLFIAIFIGLFVGSLALSLPEITGITEFTPPIPSLILSRNGEILSEVGIEKRNLTPIADVPQKVIDAFLVAEDKNFYSHNGVDYLGVLRAFWANLKAGKVVQGGSTITQQVAKQLYLSGERSIVRKVKDMLLALQLEKKFSKDEILYLYLNKVYLGGGYYGVTATFRGYFEKELQEATVAECALVAGLLVAPALYSPYINPEYAKIRQGYVLNRLLDTNKITQEEYHKAKSTVLKFRIKKPVPSRGGHFTSWIRQRVEDKVGKENFARNGYRVFTTLNWEQQEKAERYVQEGVRDIDKRQGFKGPLGHLANEEDIKNFIIEQRKKAYKKNSHYFLLKSIPDISIEYERAFDMDEINQIIEYDRENFDLSGFYKIYPGNPKNNADPFLKFIKPGENYKAVVLHADDTHRSIYVSIGGVKGIIAHENFRWARERVISEERSYIPLVTRPSSILKKGDIVLVKVLGQDKTIYQTMNPSTRKGLKNQDIIQKYKTHNFLDLTLDQESDVEASLVAIHPISGEILSLVGGQDFTRSQFNRALQALRQPGSSFKPLLYAVALEHGFLPNDTLIDSPEALGGVDENLNWKPRNYDGTFKGPITFRRSLETSRNVPTIKLASKVGVSNIIEFVKRIGNTTKLAPDLSLALGSAGMTLMDLTTTYALFPNGGKRVYPKSILRITDRFGTEYPVEDFEPYKRPAIEDLEEELLGGEYPKKQGDYEEILQKKLKTPTSKAPTEDQPEGKKRTHEKGRKVNDFIAELDEEYVYDRLLSYIMTNLLRGVIQNGTGAKARSISSFIGGKTGTTNNYIDALFLGFSSNLALGVWTGLWMTTRRWAGGKRGPKRRCPFGKNIWKAISKNMENTTLKFLVE